LLNEAFFYLSSVLTELAADPSCATRIVRVKTILAYIEDRRTKILTCIKVKWAGPLGSKAISYLGKGGGGSISKSLADPNLSGIKNTGIAYTCVMCEQGTNVLERERLR
jgi:hypothetical protein